MAQINFDTSKLEEVIDEYCKALKLLATNFSEGDLEEVKSKYEWRIQKEIDNIKNVN